MTGSCRSLNRQQSIKTSDSKMNDTSSCESFKSSSIDNNQTFEEILLADDHKNQVAVIKRKSTTSDDDSGTEDIEQQINDLSLKDNQDDNGLSATSNAFSPDEGFSEDEDNLKLKNDLMKQDLECARNIPDDVKKDICSTAMEAFHAEFARFILIPVMLSFGLKWYLITDEDMMHSGRIPPPYYFLRLDNAKAQFKCTNPKCKNVWTSMRARIMFSVSYPQHTVIVLKIFGQECLSCGSYAQALWYIDEICRVVRNFACTFHEKYYPDLLNSSYLEEIKFMQRNPLSYSEKRHDPNQRKGKMLAPHRREFCEACRQGVCYK